MSNSGTFQEYVGADVVDAYSMLANESWTSLELELSYNLPEPIPADWAAAVVRCRCRGTNARVSLHIDLRPGSQVLTFPVQRQLFAGKLTLDVIVEAALPDVGRRIAVQSEPLIVYLDEPAPPDISTPFDFKWSHFRTSLVAELVKFKDEMYYIELATEPPRIHLNLDYPDLYALLGPRSRLGRADKLIADLIARSLATNALSAATRVAVGSILVEDEETQDYSLPGIVWQDALLRNLIQQAYLDVSIGDGLRKLYNDSRSAHSAATLETRIFEFVANRLKNGKALQRSLHSVVANAA